MSRLILRVLLISSVLGSATSFCTAQSQSVATSGAAVSEIDQYARSASSLGFSGTLLVARGHEILLHKGYGLANRAGNIHNDTDTVFYIASLSKQFTAAAVLSLEARGRLKTTDTINLYLKNVPADKAGITIHQLLTHTSGLQRFGWDDATNDWRIMSRDEAVRGILNSKLDHEPGGKFLYENSNYILLAAIIESVSGTTYQAFVRDHLLRPAGINSALFGIESKPTPAAISKVALAYSDGSPAGSYFDRPKTWLRAGGGDMLFSVGDLFRWHLALREGKILPAAQLEKLFTMQVTIEPGLGYSYGWEVRQSPNGQRVVLHRGDFIGYHCEFRWYSSSDITLIVATNDEFRGGSITEPLLNNVAGILRGKSNPLPPVVAFSPEQLSRFAGNYFVQTGGWLQVLPGEGNLEIEAAGPRAADILADADPATPRERESYGESAINLIARLKRGERNAYTDVLAPQVLPVANEFEKEWNSLQARMGGLRSYQILSTVDQPGDDVSLSYVRLNFDRGSIVMGYAWKKGKLQYTQPGANPQPSRVTFAPIGANKFVSVDWQTGALLRLSFETDQTGSVKVLSVQGHGGNLSTLTAQKPLKGQPS